MPRITSGWRTLRFGAYSARLARDSDGVVHVWGEGPLDRLAGLGYAHAVDRPVQLSLLRAAGRGRLCELLHDDEGSFGVDRFARTRGFAVRAAAQMRVLDATTAALLNAYCEGVRSGFRRPWELALVGMPKEACTWEPADVLMAMELMSSVGLATLQEDLQRALIDAVRRGVPRDHLARWWSPHFDGLDDDLVDRLRALNHWEGALATAIRSRLSQTVPAIARASNAWAVRGDRSGSGKPLIAFDPHLEAGRLPAIFSEAVLEGDDGYTSGITVPGVPGVVMGRNRHVAFGFTYGFLDQSDFFVEEVQGGRCRRAFGESPCVVRGELVRRKHSKDVLLHVRENELGVLEDGEQPRDGRFLTRAWAGARADWAGGVRALEHMNRVETVEAARTTLRSMPLSANWVLADTAGDIGWCMSGSAPIRPDGGGGIAPARAWDPKRAWAPGLRRPEELPSGGADQRGVVASANDPRPRSVGGAHAVLVDAAMGVDRLDRIHTLLAELERHTPESFMAMQRDVVSVRGRRWRDRLRLAGVLSSVEGDGGAAQLARWNGRVAADEPAADRFEQFWRALMREVYGRGVFGEAAFDLLDAGTAVVSMYSAHFDDGAARFGAEWTGRSDLDQLCRDVWERVAVARRAPSRESSRIVFRHLLFGGRLPRWMGFDRGPYAIDGGGSTVHQVQTVPGPGGSRMTVAPVFRLVCDLAEEGSWTVLAGGARDRPLSRYYADGIADWLRGSRLRRRMPLRAGAPSNR